MKNRLALVAIAAALLLPAAISLAQDPPPPNPPADAAAEAPKSTSLLDIIYTGGWAMVPLGVCSLMVVTFVVLNIRMVSRANLLPASIVAPALTAAAQRDVGQLHNLCTSKPCLFTNGLLAGLRKINPEDPAASKNDMENAIAEAVGREEAQVAFWINFLSLLTGVSPMIGLLGTVSGMIGAFQKIGMGGMGKPELLAGNIGEALITTATGLCIAIPAMFAYFVFRNNLSRIVRDAEARYSEIVDSLTGASDLFSQNNNP